MDPASQAGPSNALVPVTSEVDFTKHPSGIVPALQNVVATVNLGCKLDLKDIALHARNAEYNPKRFAAVIMRIREPKTTALIFASGKMVCTGAKSETESLLAAKKYARIIQKLGNTEATFKEFKIQNIVGSCDVKFPIRLEGLAMAHGYFATYEPELFPGLIYRMKQPKIVLLIFVSGKVVLTGAKKRDEIYQAFEQIYPTLQEFRKPGAGQQPAAFSGLLPAPAATPALPAPPTGAAMGPPAARAMGPPAPRGALPSAASSQMPPPSPAHPSSSQMPPPTPLHPSQMPAETPGAPVATPWLPPATPAHQGVDGGATWQMPAAAAGQQVQYRLPAVPDRK